jgi:hypothetical protein
MESIADGSGKELRTFPSGGIMTHHRSLLLTVLAVALSACADAPTAAIVDGPDLAVVAPGHLVAGSGHVTTSAGTREFTFHAVERPDGSVGGSYKIVLPNGLFFEADVTCVAVESMTGWVAGVIRATNAAVVVVGSTSMFYAIDNGEGGSPADVVSTAAFNLPEGRDLEFCAEQPLLLARQTVTEGNVQVR